MALTVSSRNVRKRGGNGATPALLKPRRGKCTLESINANILDCNRRLFTQGVEGKMSVDR